MPNRLAILALMTKCDRNRLQLKEINPAKLIDVSFHLSPITPHRCFLVAIISSREWVNPTGSRNSNKRTKPMSRRGMHPLLMGLDKPKRPTIEKKQVELTGYESAQRKRFLRSEAEAEESEKSTAA